MIVSKKHKFAFVHIPKTGGTSITLMLKPYLGSGPTHGRGWQKAYHKYELHSPLMPFNHMGNYFKFAFVRNPWDWLVSLYHTGAINRMIGRAKRAKKPAWNELIRMINAGAVSVRCQSTWLKCHAVSVDYVARFEQYEKEVAYIFNRLGLKYKNIPHRLNNGRKRQHYTEWYDANSRRVIGRLFKHDITAFKYKFGK